MILRFFSETIVPMGSLMVVFFNLNHIKFNAKNILLFIAVRVPVAVFIVTINMLFSNQLFTYLDIPLNGLLLSYVFLRPLPIILLIFYGLFPFTLWNIFFRSISYFILPLFGYSPFITEGDLVSIPGILFSVYLVFFFIKWLRYDFVQLRQNILEKDDRNLVYVLNWAMFIYFVILQILTFLDYEVRISTLDYRRLVLVIYLIIFMGFIKQLDMHLKIKLQRQLDFQLQLQIHQLEKYSNHIEELYREVRGFRHDYSNLLTTLRLGIEDRDIDQISDIYETVLKDTSKRFRNRKYDVGRLMNIDNSALKSLLAAKFMQATENNVSVTLEVPEKIEPRGMDLADFITIVSILCDNAIEASLDIAVPTINIAFLNVNNKQVFIVENSIKEESLDISKVYSFGYSTKGSDRGIGLYNVMKIIDQYPNISLNTKSQNYKFSQVLEIYFN